MAKSKVQGNEIAVRSNREHLERILTSMELHRARTAGLISAGRFARVEDRRKQKAMETVPAQNAK